MEDEKVAVKIAEHEKEIGSLKHRVADLEELTKTIHELTLSVQELAINIQNMIKEQDRYSKTQEQMLEKIDKLEEQPAKKWDNLTTVVLTALVTGVISFLLSTIL